MSHTQETQHTTQPQHSEQTPTSPTNTSANQGSSPKILREQDRFLPIANVSRIMKNCLPKNAKVAKEAKETVQECVSEFIAFVTSEYVIKSQLTKIVL